MNSNIQKTNELLFLEEYLEHYFKGRSWSIRPFVLQKQAVGSDSIPEATNVLYYGKLDLDGDLKFFGETIPNVGNFLLFFTGAIGFSYISFLGYQVLFDVGVTNFKPK